MPRTQDDVGLSVKLESLPRLALLVGPAGIGKTRFFLENFSRLVRESKNPFERDILYLLPSAEHRERIVDLVLRKDVKAFFGERVTTFDRLMRELLRAGDFSLVTEAERSFLLEEIVSEKAGDYYSSVRDLPGFLEKVSEFIGELKDCLVSSGDFRKRVKVLEKARPEISAKYSALVEIYEAYEARLESMGARDRRDGIFLLKNMEGARSRQFRHIFIDGFFDFSRAQLEFLSWLVPRAERIALSLTLDLSKERQGLFEIPHQTLKELERIGFETVDLSAGRNYRTDSSALAFIERNLFKGEAETATVSPDGPLSLLEATGIRGEIEMVARQIRRLVKEERFYYSDIAVILRRVGPYEGVIRTVFREFQIPVEIHERERLRSSSLARTLASFFRVLLKDWKREDLFNFLKSSYVERDYEEVCALEIRGLVLGILSGRERWTKEIGGPLFEKISAFHNQSQKERTVDEWVRFVRDMIRSFGLDRIPRVYEENTRRDFATLARVGALLDEIRHAAFAEGSLRKTFEPFAREFLGLLEVDLFSLHDRDKNRVQVYDVSLARQKEYKAVFMAGLLERQFPAEIREDPLLSDEERRRIGLPERLPRQALERYLFYVGLTRAREKIVLSYPRFDLEGHEALPSFYVDEVERLFPKDSIPKRSYAVNQTLPLLEDAVEERELEAHLVERLYDREQAADPQARRLSLSLYNRFLDRPSFQALLPRILFEPSAVILDEQVRKAFLPRGGVFKPTGLVTYGECPYRYFASQVLNLEEKEEGIDAKLVGKILHKVLEDYWNERIKSKNKTLESLVAAKDFAKARLHELLKETPLLGDKGYRIELKIRQMEEWLLKIIDKEIEEGGTFPSFRVLDVERKFGFSPKNDYFLLHDSLREDLKVRGQIDRIEVDPSGRHALVIDYKTGSSFKYADLAFGTALQLPLYLLALQQLYKLTPLGGEIYQINKAERKGFYSKEALEALGVDPPSRKNIYEKKEFDRILERTRQFSRKFAEGITKAEIPVRPRDCVDYCPFPAVCRIEKWRLKFIEQEIREEDKKNGIA